MDRVQVLVTDAAGQSMVEYGIIVAVIAAVCIGAYKAVGNQVNVALATLISRMGGNLDGHAGG